MSPVPCRRMVANRPKINDDKRMDILARLSYFEGNLSPCHPELRFHTLHLTTFPMTRVPEHLPAGRGILSHLPFKYRHDTGLRPNIKAWLDLPIRGNGCIKNAVSQLRSYITKRYSQYPALVRLEPRPASARSPVSSLPPHALAPHAPASLAPASRAPTSRAPASRAPASRAPASRAHASRAPTSRAPASPSRVPCAFVPRAAAPRALAPRVLAPRALAPRAPAPRALAPRAPASPHRIRCALPPRRRPSSS
ncbi:hypothetical protein BC938DRAFT_477635 [Jimgerdemannia flammicorona]|uniref:Uncharacterized protein n=1 Tax=Jimgerdemannia flammicorona TaxID=994334 RepID=A0A433P8K0_9FUNG|nr:hypothetical protein BC938DRAFT_477635 [Jimgerdemannia flammicorona]